jgi:hypothetical protein
MRKLKKLSLCLLAACAAQVLAAPSAPLLLATAQAQPQGPPGYPFRFNSTHSQFAVQGNFAGLFRVGGNHVELDLDEADVFLGKMLRHSSRRLIKTVTFCLGTETGEGGGKWKIEQRGTEIPIEEIFSPRDKADLAPLSVSIPTGGGDISKKWIIVEFRVVAIDAPKEKRYVGTCYAHSDSKIFAPGP